jgi:hypothetical protein
VEDRVDVLRLQPRKAAAGIAGRDCFDRDPSPRAFLVDLGCDRTRAVSPRSNDEPLPAPGTSSAIDSGVCPNRCRSALEGPLRRRRMTPPSITTSDVYRSPSIWISPNVTSFTFTSTFSHPRIKWEPTRPRPRRGDDRRHDEQIAPVAHPVNGREIWPER